MSNGDSILDRLPEILPREDDSIFRRYVEAHDEEVMEDYEDEIESIKLSRQIDQAEGDDLDRIGRLFGTVGRRLGRDDTTYRRFLKSVVQAFAGRGTDFSMRNAIAAALDVDIEDVQLEEDFENVEYVVVLSEWSPHAVSTIYDISELVDPSGVAQSDLRYKIPDEDTIAGSDIVTTDGFQIVSEAEASTDEVLVGIRIAETFEELSTADTLEQIVEDSVPDTDEASDLVEENVTDDGTTVGSSSADATTTDTATVLWDDGDWDSMRWGHT